VSTRRVDGRDTAWTTAHGADSPPGPVPSSCELLLKCDNSGRDVGTVAR